jgi:hypothetical protein
VATFQVTAAAAQGDDPQVVNVKYQDGLIGSGEPVPLVITIGGDSATACNFGFANVAVSFQPLSVATVRRGDPNGDEKVDIADPIWIINELFRDGPASPCQSAGDANDDGNYDTSDVAVLIDYLFRGSAPPANLGGCAADPTPDSLPCDTRC